jgi:hypothetical protein
MEHVATQRITQATRLAPTFWSELSDIGDMNGFPAPGMPVVLTSAARQRLSQGADPNAWFPVGTDVHAVTGVASPTA